MSPETFSPSTGGVFSWRINRSRSERNEKASYDTNQYRWQTQAWIFSQNGHQGGPGNFIPSTTKGQKKTLRLMLKKASIKAICFYRKYIRPVMPDCCRFSPTCSEYAMEALSRYGFLKGWGKALIRLLKCHPFSGKSGYDPVI
jgi:putative membrane protein insertion efficiency factor